MPRKRGIPSSADPASRRRIDEENDASPSPKRHSAKSSTKSSAKPTAPVNPSDQDEPMDVEPSIESGDRGFGSDVVLNSEGIPGLIY